MKSSDIVLVLGWSPLRSPAWNRLADALHQRSSVAILFPPAAAGFLTGCSCDLFINICLTLLGYIPGHIHAFVRTLFHPSHLDLRLKELEGWLIYKNAQAEERYGHGGYKYVGNGEYTPIDGYSHVPAHPQYQPNPNPPTYGATQ
ncbi:hypothetical protein P7C70_g2196, partial [Phenoliferia sp. Uapishka_3]